MEEYRLRKPREYEIFAIASSMLGASRIRVICADGKVRMARIPGKMKDFKIRTDDLLLIKPWVIQSDEKCDIVYRYTNTSVYNLKRMNLYPKELE